jgi:DNA-binding transcriptional regulator YbjK
LAPTRTRIQSSRPRGAARREALLDAALEIAANVGADAITHRRVAEVAGLPLASTTYWFDSKEHLLSAALELAAERDMVRLQEFGVYAAASDADPLTLAIEAITEPLDHRLAGTRGSLLAAYALMLEAARRPTLQSVISRWTEAYLDLLSSLLERAGSSAPRYDAELVAASADGLLIEQLASGKTRDIGSRLHRLAHALVASR